MNRGELNLLLEERDVLNLPAVEVGVAEGRYSKEILDWGVPYLYLVDLWAHHSGGLAELGSWDDETHQSKLDTVIDTLQPYEGKYQILRGWSHQMCDNIDDNSLGFAFIDASHDYKNVLRDLKCYWPKLVGNGVMAGHDWTVEGVEKAVREFAEVNSLKINLLPTADPGDISYWLEKK